MCDEKPASRTANAVTTAVRHGIVQKKIIWKQHLNGRLCAALAIALAVYLIPFALSHLYGAANYGQSGLGLVLRENVVRLRRA